MSLQPDDPATAAFEQLRAEVTLLRMSLEGIAGAVARKPAGDSPALGKLTKAISAVLAQLSVLEAQSASVVQPEALTRTIGRAAAEAVAAPIAELREDRAVFRQWSTHMAEQRVVRVERRTWFNRMAIAAWVGVFVGGLAWGLLLGPVARMLPAGWQAPERLAAATLGLPRTAAADRMLHLAAPEQSRRLRVLQQLPETAVEPLRRCLAGTRPVRRLRCDLGPVVDGSSPTRGNAGHPN